MLHTRREVVELKRIAIKKHPDKKDVIGRKFIDAVDLKGDKAELKLHENPGSNPGSYYQK